VYHRDQGQHVYQQVPELEQRLSELQAQIDRLSLSLHLWRQTQDHLQPMERRLSQLTDQCAEILDRWAVTGERHAQVVNELETRLTEWNNTEARLQQDASQRIQHLGRIIEREWTDLRRIHEEPMRELREQAATLGEVSIAAAHSAQAGFERAEARLAAIEQDLHRWVTDLAREVRMAVADHRAGTDRPGWPHVGPSPTWPLDGVMRLHEQIRQGADSGAEGSTAQTIDGAAAGTAPTSSPATPSDDGRPKEEGGGRVPLPAAPAELTQRVDSLERAVTDGQTELRESASKSERVTRRWRWAAVVLAAGTLLAFGLAWQSQRQARQASARASEVERQSRLAQESATEQLAVSRKAAEKDISQARAAAAAAQTIATVLAAPDLIRYNLAGQGAGAPVSAQLLWSRSRGMVFTGSRLPVPASNTTYQLWLLTAGEPVSAATFVPDEAGRVTLALDTPPRVPRPVISVSVTIEPSGGSPMPSGEMLLARVP
jgi:hypothetical protein